MMISITSTLACIMAVLSPLPEKSSSQTNNDLRCGLYCLTLGLSALGNKDFTLERMEDSLGQPSALGYSLMQLSDSAKKQGFETVSVRTSLDNLTYRRNVLGERFICIASYGPEHFVLIYGSDGNVVRIADPPRTFSIDVPVFEREWTGNCLLIGTSPLSPEEEILAKRRTREIYMRIGATIGPFLIISVLILAIARLRKHSSKVLASVMIAVCVLSGCIDRTSNSDLSRDTQTSDSTNVILGGQIEVSPAIHSLGLVQGGDRRTIPIVSRIRNTSDVPLRIESVKASCACTEVAFDKSVLKPGEAAELKASIEIGESQSHRAATIKVESSDPVHPVSEILIDWVADLPLKTDPATFERFELSADRENEFEIAVFSKFITLCDKCEVRISEARDSLILRWLPNKEIQATGHSKNPTENKNHETKLGTLKALVTPKDIDSHHREQIEILLTCGGETKATTQLPMTWTFRRNYRIVPSRIFFGILTTGQASSQTIVVQSLNDDKLVIRSVKIRGDVVPLDTKIVRVSDTVSRIGMTIIAPPKPGPFTNEIEIETDSKVQPIIRLPVSCLVE